MMIVGHCIIWKYHHGFTQLKLEAFRVIMDENNTANAMLLLRSTPTLSLTLARILDDEAASSDGLCS